MLSFVNLGIYWNNHHHMLHAADHITGAALWPNLHLLFWLSLIPFTTAWMGENHFAAGADGDLRRGAADGRAWRARSLQAAIIRHDGPHSKLRAAVGGDRKGNLSLAMYALAIPLAFVHQFIADALYVGRRADVVDSR